MQNRFETQLKIQNNTFSKINLFVREKGSQQKESNKKPSGHFNTKVFWFDNVEKHEIGDAKGDKKKRKRRHKTIGTRWNMEQEKHVFENKNKRKERNTKRTK